MKIFYLFIENFLKVSYLQKKIYFSVHFPKPQLI